MMLIVAPRCSHELKIRYASHFVARDMFPSPDAAHHPPDRQHRDRHEQSGGERNIDRHAFVVRALHQVAEQADDVIADGGDRQAFDRGLQPQLQSRALVHRLEQIAVLPLQLDVDAGAQQIGGARELFRQMSPAAPRWWRRCASPAPCAAPGTTTRSASLRPCARRWSAGADARSRYRRGWRRSGTGWRRRPLPARRRARSIRRAGDDCRSSLSARRISSVTSASRFSMRLIEGISRCASGRPSSASVR